MKAVRKEEGSRILYRFAISLEPNLLYDVSDCNVFTVMFAEKVHSL